MSLPCFEATLARENRCRCARNHSSRHGLLLRGDRSAGPARSARKTSRGRRRPRSPRSADDVQLRSARIWRSLRHADVREILHRFSPLVEPLSLDEAYLDVTAHPGAPGPLAQVIRDLIFQKTKLTSSAGIGPNKLIAKIASSMRKPNGQLEVSAAEVPEFMVNLSVREIWGIGAKTEKRLQELGVKTCGDLQRFSRPELVDLFGKFGSELFDLCRGIDNRPVEPDRPRKSLSTEETFPSDMETLEQCEERLAELFQELMADLAQKETTRRVTKIFVKLKFADFTRTTAERAGLEPSLSAFRSLLAEVFARTGKKVRLIGVGVRFAESEPEEMQMALFSEAPN